MLASYRAAAPRARSPAAGALAERLLPAPCAEPGGQRASNAIGTCEELYSGGHPRLLAGVLAARALLLLACGASVCALLLPRLRAPPAPPAPSAARRPPPARTPEDELRADVERQLPYLPLTYWHEHHNRTNTFYKTKRCAPLPSVFDLEYSNTYWQTLRSSRGVFYLYGAYLDVRNGSIIGPAVRLLAVHDRIKPTLPTHCQLWFEERPGPVVVRVLKYDYVWVRRWGNYRDGVLQPYLLACVLPADVRALRPAAVSLVEKPCDRATNCLRVHFDEPPDRKQKEFAVCVKGLDFQHEDLSVRLVEWIELVRLLGADKVFFYELQVHPNISKVLDYYHARGIVERTAITLPGGQPNLPGLQHLYLKRKTTNKRQMEVVPYNDCLYRNMYRYRWLTLLDVDEVIVPMQDPDWKSLLQRVVLPVDPATGLPPCSSYLARNIFYLNEHSREPSLPRYMHLLQHVYRTRVFTRPGLLVKAFHDTRRVTVLHNHYPLACVDGNCLSYPMHVEQARLQHYRPGCDPKLSEHCVALLADPVRDAALWRWAERLVPSVRASLAELALLPAEPAPAAPRTSTIQATHGSKQ